MTKPPNLKEYAVCVSVLVAGKTHTATLTIHAPNPQQAAYTAMLLAADAKSDRVLVLGAAEAGELEQFAPAGQPGDIQIIVDGHVMRPSLGGNA